MVVSLRFTFAAFFFVSSVCARAGSEKIPKQFRLVTESKPGAIAVFSETVDGERAFEGVVERKGEMTPVVRHAL